MISRSDLDIHACGVTPEGMPRRAGAKELSPSQTQRSIWSIVGIYAVVAGLWILFSDRLLAMLVPSEEVFLKLSIYKGLVFVAVTSLILCALIFRLTTRLQRVRDSLQASERDYRELVNSVNSIVLRWNHAGQVTFANEFALNFFGYSQGELVGKNLLDTIFPRIDRAARHLRQMMADVDKYPECYANDQSEAIRRNGERVWIAWTNRVLRDHTGTISEILSVGNDLTRSQKAQEALRASEERFRSLVETTSDWIWETDAHGVYTYASPKIKDLLGYEPSEVIGKTVLEFVALSPEGEPSAKAIRDCLATGRPFQAIAIGHWDKFGRVILLETSGVPVFGNDGVLTGFRGIDRDVTERKRVEDALVRAKEVAEAANRAKDQFIAVLSHELRTPLTPVLAAVSAIEEQTDLPTELRADVELIHRNVELEARLIDDLLDVTRISRGKIELHRETISLHACLQTTLEICASDIQAKSLKVSVALNARQHFVSADPARLQQVFWNLLKNAIKFTPTCGRISIRTENSGSQIRIHVADSGIGIAPEVLPRIFNTFEQGEQSKSRQFGGLGLGLSIARAVMELHHGSLHGYSEGKNQGSTFITELETVMPDLSLSSAAQFELPTGEPHLLKVLMVDDHADTLRILSRMVSKWGFCVMTATCVREALALAAREPFDLVISDLGLPDGSGLEIMRETKMRYGLRGIAISGYGSDGDLRESEEAGFDAHLTKPISFQALKTAIHRITSETVPA